MERNADREKNLLLFITVKPEREMESQTNA